MIQQIPHRLWLDQSHHDHLGTFPRHTKEMWDDPPDDTIKAIKTIIRDRLLTNQGNICAYCGLDLGGTSEGQIEHIAPKAKYQDFTFECDNLAMACHFCNGFSKKGNHHTISNLQRDYQNCSFKLVHPYFDDPSDHFGWVSNDRKVLIQSLSDKGTYSIDIFELDDPRMSELRGKKIIADIVLSNNVTPQIDDALIQQVITYKPNP